MAAILQRTLQDGGSGRWLSEDYRVPGEPAEPPADEPDDN